MGAPRVRRRAKSVTVGGGSWCSVVRSSGAVPQCAPGLTTTWAAPRSRRRRLGDTLIRASKPNDEIELTTASKRSK